MTLRSDTYAALEEYLPLIMVNEYREIETMFTELGLTSFTDDLEDSYGTSIGENNIKTDALVIYNNNLIKNTFLLLDTVGINRIEDEDIMWEYADCITIVRMIYNIITRTDIVDHMMNHPQHTDTGSYLEIALDYIAITDMYNTTRFYNLLMDDNSIKPFIRQVYTSHIENMASETVSNDIITEIKISRFEDAISKIIDINDPMVHIIKLRLRNNEPIDKIQGMLLLTNLSDGELMIGGVFIVMYNMIINNVPRDSAFIEIKSLLPINVYMDVYKLVNGLEK